MAATDSDGLASHATARCSVLESQTKIPEIEAKMHLG
jgi:hypothetical protein